MTQSDLATRVGVHQTWISDIELGRGRGAPLELWIAIGVAIRRPFAASLSRPTDPDTTLRDAGHLAMQETLLALAASTGRRAAPERPSNSDDPRHASDVAMRDDTHHLVILPRLGTRSVTSEQRSGPAHRKHADTLATAGDGYRVASVWVVRASAANRAIVARYPNLFAATFDGSSRAWVRTLVDGADAPELPGLVWFDPSRRRLIEWRRP